MNAAAVFYGPSDNEKKKQTVNNLNFARLRAAPISMLKYLQTYFETIKRVWIIAVESIIMLFVCHLSRCLAEFMFGCVWGKHKTFHALPNGRTRCAFELKAFSMLLTIFDGVTHYKPS